MVVLISITGFRPGATFGAETYLRGLLGSLRRYRGDTRIVVAAMPICHPWLKEIFPDCEMVEVSGRLDGFRRLREGIKIRRVLRNIQPDVVFFPFNIMPAVAVPSVLMVHDLVSEFYVNNFPFWKPLQNRMLRMVLRRSLRRATMIVTPTQAVAHEIYNYSGGDRVPVIPISEAAERLEANYNATCWDEGWTEPFLLLQTGSKLPHKAQHIGVEALKKLLEKRPELVGNIRLVMTGCNDRERDRFLRLVRGTIAADYLSTLGKVSQQRLESLTRRAALVLLPTLYEGFGLGLIEAQSRGCAVVASDIPVLREVSGGHAEFFPPGDSGAMADTIGRLLCDGKRRGELERRGRENAYGWTWDDHARRLLDVLRQAAET